MFIVYVLHTLINLKSSKIILYINHISHFSFDCLFLEFFPCFNLRHQFLNSKMSHDMIGPICFMKQFFLWSDFSFFWNECLDNWERFIILLMWQSPVLKCKSNALSLPSSQVTSVHLRLVTAHCVKIWIFADH